MTHSLHHLRGWFTATLSQLWSEMQVLLFNVQTPKGSIQKKKTLRKRIKIRWEITNSLLSETKHPSMLILTLHVCNQHSEWPPFTVLWPLLHNYQEAVIFNGPPLFGYIITHVAFQCEELPATWGNCDENVMKWGRANETGKVFLHTAHPTGPFIISPLPGCCWIIKTSTPPASHFALDWKHATSLSVLISPVSSAYLPIAM